MNTTDAAMLRARELFEKSGLTLDELGQKMGYEGDVARKSAWQFLNKTADPRVSTLRKFAAAIGVPVADLFSEGKRGRQMTTGFNQVRGELQSVQKSIKLNTA